MGWSRLLDGAERADALRVCDEIAAALRPLTGLPSSLSRGSAGVALFFRYYDGSTEFLDRATDAVGSVPMPPWLFAGYTGVAWVADHVAPGHEICDIVDAELFDVACDAEQFDLVAGLVGLGVYATARSQSKTIDRIVERLHAADPWWTGPEHLSDAQRERYPDGCYDLGVAHGLAGVVAFLGPAGPADRLLSHRGTDAVPALVAPGRPDTPGRSAWCYGDPGVASALLRAGRTQDAVAIARAAAARPAGVSEAGLCHGAAGLAHIYNRISQTTGDEPLADAARTWVRRTIDLLDFGDPGFLEGAAGAGLALLAASSDVEPLWDRVLLLS